MNRDEYDFEAELAHSVSAIVNDQLEKHPRQDTIVFENLYDDTDDLDDLDDFDRTAGKREAVPSPQKKTGKKGSAVGKVAIISAVVVVLVTAVICASLYLVRIMQNNALQDTYAYQIDQAVRKYNVKDYEGAREYLNHALTYYHEVDQIKVRFYLFQCERELGNDEKAVAWLNELLNYDKYNTQAISLLAEVYQQMNDSLRLNELIQKYMNTEAEGAITRYVNKMPGVSHCSGQYGYSIEVSLFNDTGYEIHYTTDGLTPTAKDPLFQEDKPIKILKGTTTLKAVSIDPSGIVSEVLECKYVINYAVPEKPVVKPASGTYDKEQIISVENFVQDGSYTAYYTLDGSIPTDDSAVYTGPLDMPAGNNVFSVAFISKDGITSSVIKRNYNLKLSARYNFEDALAMLRQKLIESGELSASGDTRVSGEPVRFVYYRKQTIDAKEMYLVYYDIKNGTYTRQDYLYGVEVVTGKIYKVTNADDTMKAEEYK